MVKNPFSSTHEKLWLLQGIEFGARVAEEEPKDSLESYFVETNEWREVFDDKVDIVYGAKGSGKSALYALLMSAKHKSALEKRDVLLAPAENPRGAPVFRDLVADPPGFERQFIGLWKLYFVSILYNEVFKRMDFEGNPLDRIKEALQSEGLLQESSDLDLRSLLRSIWAYVRRFVTPAGVTGTLELDPASGLPKGLSGKITFSDPTAEEAKSGRTSVDQLLSLANKTLRQNGNWRVWILLDRLDVAFPENPDLEANALKALFRVYSDLRAYECIELKIFIRSDVWSRITKEGFREASHFVRTLTISWDQNALLNLIVRRLLFNEPIRDHYKSNPAQLVTNDEQQEFFYTVFPEKPDEGETTPRTFDWLLSRTKDGIGNAPREMIHFLTALRNAEIRGIQNKEKKIDRSFLFSQISFREAMAEVSRVRLEQTLYAEYPDYRQFVEALKGRAASYEVATLWKLWKGKSQQSTLEIANQLADIGFFAKWGDPESPTFSVPVLYHDALQLKSSR